MSEIAVRDESYPTPADRPMRLIEWAEEARAANALAQSLCQTPFAGQYRGDAMGATAAILKGAEVGLTPVTALGAFDLIQGTPAAKAITLRALVQAHGHSVWIEHSTDTECVAKARRRGEPEVHESRWTMARATKMGLHTKANWKNQPAAMLMARATSEVCRMVAADVILGIGYSSEEVADSEPEPTTTARREPRKTTARRAIPESPEPEFDDAAPQADPGPEQRPASDALSETAGATQPDAPDPGSDRDQVTRSQLTKIAAQMRDLGLTDREVALAFVADVIGRDVSSRNELTRGEASQLIERMGRDLGELPEPEGDPS